MAWLPPVQHDLPRCWGISRLAGSVVLRAWGWDIEGELPATRKAVLIAAPHTSNWDFWFALLAGWTYGVSIQWLGKDALFKGPLGLLLKLLGGISVDRSRNQGLVTAVVERFESEPRLLLMVPAEGTRSYRTYWKSGFYWMAKDAGVPIILGFLDYRRKRAGFGPSFVPSGDVHADMEKIRAFYAGISGKYPDQASRIRLKSEDGVEEGRGA